MKDKRKINVVNSKVLKSNFIKREDFVFSTNPTKEDLEQVEVEGKILVVYSNNVKECVKFRERLGESTSLSIWLDQSPITMKDGKKLDFEEFFLDPYLEMVLKAQRKLKGFTDAG